MIGQLELQNITLHSQHPLVHGVSLTVTKGRVLALVGGSGSGKSLTCAAALGVLPVGVRASAGQVLADGQPVTPEALRGRLVATIMQNPRSAFNPVRTLWDHARETCRVAGKSPDPASVAAVMAAVGLAHPGALLKQYPFEMSGGMLQRMMIALALLSDAPFIVADEPTTDLDVLVQAQILDLLEAMIARRGQGMLLVTHDMGVVARLADDVAVMECGVIVEQGSVGQIFHHPVHPVTRRLISAHLALYGLESE
ncbi:nickel import ATP-binding protein NikD [Shimwellia pseudoproteus]|uniref:nickel import ATP-binding protein NikD n=1 Tax=Shimwellia pseudoproteus TaxID=570012 RepID=UPI0018EAC437|nr:nickel import ATP-binding protein NikD [Shimwellia pseudoproteus]MBJ3816093.1 nickel import ATP-binding protein NikD [Shimwellia pseudoproteus]